MLFSAAYRWSSKSGKYNDAGSTAILILFICLTFLFWHGDCGVFHSVLIY